MHRSGPRSSSAGADAGLCSLHGKRRNRSELMPWNQQPGKMRCQPQKECHLRSGERPRHSGREMGRVGGAHGSAGESRGPSERERRSGTVRGGRDRSERARTDRRDRGDKGETAMCRLHRQRRSIRQMRQVGQGVFECLEGSRCKQAMDRRVGGRGAGGVVRGSGERGRFRDQRGPSFVERGAGARQHQRRAERPARQPHEPRFDDTNAESWAPSAGAGAANAAGVRRRTSRVEHKVWCALHGKHLPVSQCEFVQDCCHVCLDPSTCLATPLEIPSMLLTRGCLEVLCSKHHTLRSVGFVELSEKPAAYRCMPEHACRGVTVPHMSHEIGAAATAISGSTTAAGVGAMPDMDDDEEVYTGMSVTNTFLPQNGRETVSSFFM